MAILVLDLRQEMNVSRETLVTRLVYCPRCGGNMWPDSQDHELLACLHCARRYIAPESLLRRSPTPLELNATYRRSIAHHEARM